MSVTDVFLALLALGVLDTLHQNRRNIASARHEIASVRCQLVGHRPPVFQKLGEVGPLPTLY
jgi:hypothetical protein